MKNSNYLERLSFVEEQGVMAMMILSSNFDGVVNAVKDGYVVDIWLLETLHRCGYDDIIERIKDEKSALITEDAEAFFKSYLKEPEFEASQKSFEEEKAQAIKEGYKKQLKKLAEKYNGRIGPEVLDYTFFHNCQDALLELFSDQELYDYLPQELQMGAVEIFAWNHWVSRECLIANKNWRYLLPRLDMEKEEDIKLLGYIIENGGAQEVYELREEKAWKLLAEKGYTDVYREPLKIGVIPRIL